MTKGENGNLSISDLHTVKEDYDDENDEDFGDNTDPNLNPQKYVRTKREYADHMTDHVETSCIMNYLKDYMMKVRKVHSFLITIIHRRRFLKKRESIRMV